MNLKEKIVALCKQRGLTVRELERRAGLKERTIQHWDESEPSGQKLYSVAAVLNVPIEELLSVYDPEIGRASYVLQLQNQVDEQTKLLEELGALKDDQDFRALLFAYKKMTPAQVRIMKSFMKSMTEENEHAD